jgi:hypothetical protein
MTLRRSLKELWELITTISIALVFTTIGLGTLLVFGLLLALPIVAILVLSRYLF